MDYISSPNIFTISSCELNTKFHGRCYSDWSKTNLISVVTQEGIYILQPHLERDNEPFEINFIKNPSDRFRHSPFERSNVSLENIWNSLDSRQYAETFLDPALLTSVTKLSADSYPRRFRLAKWSPKINTFPAQCLLTTITVDFQLAIYSHWDGFWIFKENLSKIYDELWMQTILASDMPNTTFDGIRKNLHSLSFNAICWKEHGTSYPILLASTLTGEIVIWTVDVINGKNETSTYQGDRLSFKVLYIIRTQQEFINNIQLYNNLLVSTSRNGQVNLYDLSEIFDDIEDRQSMQQVTETAQTGTLAIIEILPTAILWHHDNIEVMDFYLQPLTKDTFRIVLSKSTNICWCTIHYKPKSSNEPAVLAISDSFSAINGLDPEVSLHQTPATWLRPAGDGMAVLVADDGSFFQLKFVDDRHDTSPSFNAIRTGKIDLTDMIPRGLCTSPNGVLITMISCVTYLVDPLKMPAPTKLIILPTINEKKFFMDCMQNLLDENWLFSNNIRSPMDVCDRIDCLRSMFPSLNPHQFERLRILLRDEISQLGYPKNSTQLVMLKIISFILLKLENLDNFKTSDDLIDLDLERNVYDVILMESIEKILKATLTSDSKLVVNENQVKSLRNIFQWLEATYAGHSIRDRYMERYNKFIKDYAKVKHEICTICQSDIPFKSNKFGVCKNNHNFFRCSRSLLILNMGQENSIQCKDCKRNYLTKLVWPTDNLWLCLYCQ
jgi:hypothetical protein